MAKRKPAAAWARLWQQGWSALARSNLRAGSRAAAKAIKPVLPSRKPPPGDGDWLAGAVIGPAGMRRYWLYRPPGLRLKPGERLPLLVMLHGGGQTAQAFAYTALCSLVLLLGGALVAGLAAAYGAGVSPYVHQRTDGTGAAAHAVGIGEPSPGP